MNKPKQSSIVVRRGYHLVELIGAISLFAVAVSLVVGIAGFAVGFEKAEKRRVKALATAENLMERLTSLPFDSLQEVAVNAPGFLPANLVDDPELQAKIEIKAADGQPGLILVRVTVARLDPSKAARPVVLVAWVSKARRLGR
jgi:hypothetical protein